MIVVVDSDGIIGSLNPEDLHYTNCNKILHELTNLSCKLVYPVTSIVESITFLQGRASKPSIAEKLLALVLGGNLIVEGVNFELLQQASQFLNLKGSKHDTLFDAIVIATAKKYKADAIFSFDKFYKKNGFKLASEL